MNTLGKILMALAAGMLLYNVFVIGPYNEAQLRDHPIISGLSLGANLKQGFTLLQMGFFGIVGLVLVICSDGRNRESK